MASATHREHPQKSLAVLLKISAFGFLRFRRSRQREAYSREVFLFVNSSKKLYFEVLTFRLVSLRKPLRGRRIIEAFISLSTFRKSLFEPLTFRPFLAAEAAAREANSRGFSLSVNTSSKLFSRSCFRFPLLAAEAAARARNIGGAPPRCNCFFRFTHARLDSAPRHYKIDPARPRQPSARPARIAAARPAADTWRPA